MPTITDLVPRQRSLESAAKESQELIAKPRFLKLLSEDTRAEYAKTKFAASERANVYTL
ncbi:hypothetical protein PENSUB_12333 [Penicillium subrubescens]|uniref:Uncharacterized protein n=1 Tax=Penicillium subrubescens TaxID=1316194 RepID=A0A1Q5SZ91_9EURO|nr:hypothetical protein PENSUB_12333 [Penicillium subrubescens]